MYRDKEKRELEPKQKILILQGTFYMFGCRKPETPQKVTQTLFRNSLIIILNKISKALRKGKQFNIKNQNLKNRILSIMFRQ